MNWLGYIRLGAALLVGFACVAAKAEVDAQPLPGDPNLVVFQYDANNSYRVLTRPASVTVIVLQPDERLRFLALGDTASWQYAQKDNYVLIKPTYPQRTTSGTLVTTKREYQLFFVSTGDGGRWYQRVSFQYTDLIVAEAEAASRLDLETALGGTAPADKKVGDADGSARPTRSATPQMVPDTSGSPDSNVLVDPSSLNFNYQVEGDDSIKPERIYDDGHVTFIRLKEGAAVPALFHLLGSDAELVEYSPRGDSTIVVHQVLDRGLLKLGDKEVKFTNRAVVKGTFFSRLLHGVSN